jgi:hypothetical protein
MSELLNEDLYKELRLLVSQTLDGSLSREGIQRLETILESGEQVRAYYREYLSIYCDLIALAGTQQSNLCSMSDSQDESFWKMLADYEKSAPALEVPGMFEQRPLIEKVIYPPREKKTLSKFTVVSAVLSIAAIILLIAFVHYTPFKLEYEVATLNDMINAKWGDSGVSLGAGSRLRASYDLLMLREGLAEMVFDNDARIVVEGPAEFQILSDNQINLKYGSVYAVVPGRAYGFTVITQNSRVIDLGTEFGVRSNLAGDMEVHVVKGKINLLSGIHERRNNITVKEGTAKRLNASTEELSDTIYRKDIFARCIDSETGTVWRGQETIDLADIVGGGNGFGTGRQGACIDTTTGQWKPESYLPADSDVVRPGAKMYNNYLLHPVKTSPFIDGVFIPDNDQGPVAVSTHGHSFDAFPVTSGLGWGGILYIESTLLKRVIKLNNERYGIPGKPALFMHGNAGITFDLEAVRKSIPGSLKEFSAAYGISDEYLDGGTGFQAYADFWVLVDGQVRFCKKGVKVHQGGSISVVLSKQDRFLTLVTTDGGQGSPEYDNRTSFTDWCIFGRPVLLTE